MSHTPFRRRLDALRRWRPEVSATTLTLATSLFSSLACNTSLWRKLADLPAVSPLFFAGMFVLVTALQFIILSLFVNRWTAKPVLALLSLLTGASVYFMDRFGVYMDAAMIRNVFETDVREVRDLLAWDMLPYLGFYVLLPWGLLARVRIRRPPLRRSGWQPLLAVLLAALVTGGAFFTVSKTLVPLMREQKTLRYLITPSNYLYSLIRVYILGESSASKPREPVGLDAKPLPRPAGAKPRLLLVVLGETQRAANWGLNGYSRQTTPELAARNVINYAQTTSCGTNTATSVPCMFSVYGRRHYDEDRIRGSESVLNVLQHAGQRVLWRDNQSGCKGVCKGVEELVMTDRKDPAFCHGDECFDGILLSGLDQEVRKTPGDLVVVMHLMGLHGPAYFQRYPAEFRRFTPTCDTTQLETCTHQQIVNTYDNGMLYSDHVIASMIDFLKTQAGSRDTALLFVSDHGESLGENNLYLHSIPWSIAPDTQTHVPMVLWLSPEFRQAAGLREDCLRQRAAQPASHDNLFHTVLGLMGVGTSVYESGMDLTAGCR